MNRARRRLTAWARYRRRYGHDAVNGLTELKWWLRTRRRRPARTGALRRLRSWE